MNIQWYSLFVTPKDCADILKMEGEVLNKNQRKEVLRVLFEERFDLFRKICIERGLL